MGSTVSTEHQQPMRRALELGPENRATWLFLAEAMLDNAMLKDIASKKW